MGRVLKSSEYTFNKSAKTITFNSINTGLELSQIQLITDVTNSTVIYQFNKTGYGGTLVGLVLTLTYDTTGAGFNNSDNLMIIIDDAKDNSQLYSGTLSTIGASTAVDTTDFQNLSIQLSGTWEGIVIVEGSNNGSDYIPLMVYPINEFSLVDNINEDGVYSLKTSTKFVRLNVQQLLTGSITALILGRTFNGPDAIDAVSAAMDKNQRMPLLVEEVSSLKKDSTNALIQSDADQVYSYVGSASVGTPYLIIDTTGYNSITMHIISGNGVGIILGATNDLSVPLTSTVQMTSYDIKGTAIPSAFPSQVGIYVYPCYSKYIKVYPNGASGSTVNIKLYLRSQPVFPNSGGNGAAVSLQGVGNSAISQTTLGPSTGGTLSGTAINVASNASPGSASVPSPIIIGGRQAPTASALSGIVRTLLLDPDGKVVVTTNQNQTISNNFQNGASLQVTDLSQLEGQSVIELLAQVLLELRINNQYLSELPQQLNSGKNNLDDPSQFRAEQSIFAQ